MWCLRDTGQCYGKQIGDWEGRWGTRSHGLLCSFAHCFQRDQTATTGWMWLEGASAGPARTPNSLSSQPPAPACPDLHFSGRLTPWISTIPGTLLLTRQGLFCQLFWRLPRCYLQAPNLTAWISCWHLMWAWKCKEGLCISPQRLTTFQRGKSLLHPVGRELLRLLTAWLRVSEC